MCGIAGIYTYDGRASGVDSAELSAMRDHMRSRGPDGKGAWFSPDRRVGLAHRRLAIIDLSERAAQPMESSDGALVVTFNGEIYNHLSLRKRLEARGCRFRTTSDTEVLLHAYAELGVDMLRDLRGMFAFALWDSRRRALLLARDPYGIKPLYYSDDGRSYRFASQVRALIAGGAVSKARDPAAEVGFLLWGHVPEPRSIYKAVRAVPAGCFQWVEQDGLKEPRCYESLAEIWTNASTPQPSENHASREDRLREALRESVRHHMVADVPVGAFLSGGVDSGALLGLMAEQHADTQALTIGFDEFHNTRHDEVPLAASLAKHYGVSHRVRRVTREEFQKDLPLIMDAMDQPSIDGFNTWMVSKAASELGLKVAVSGLGGDELFGGYRSFRDVPRLVRTCSWAASVPAVGRAARIAGTLVTARAGSIHPKVAGALEYGGTFPGAYFLKRGLFMPWEVSTLLPAAVAEEGLSELALPSTMTRWLTPEPPLAFARVAVLEASLYMRNQLLRDSDWAGMAHSLEIRVPLVDAMLVRQAAPLLAGSGLWKNGKRLLASAPARPLPQEVVDKPKTGFSTPVARWLQEVPGLDLYRRVPLLRRPETPWARRLAYSLLAGSWTGA